MHHVTIFKLTYMCTYSQQKQRRVAHSEPKALLVAPELLQLTFALRSPLSHMVLISSSFLTTAVARKSSLTSICSSEKLCHITCDLSRSIW